MTPIIHATTNYDLFRFHEQNRKAGSNRQLPKLIDELDLTPYVPIVVDEDFYIVDGQNRFMACKTLGKPVYYVILPREYDTNSSIITLNKAQQAWRQDEFLHFWASTKGGCWKDLERIYTLRELGYWAYIMVYDKQHCAPIYKQMQCWCNNRFIYSQCPRFEDYDRRKKYPIHENQLSLQI